MILLHTSTKSIKQLRKIKQHNICGFKPSGLWYAPNKTWINWCKENMPSETCNYYYFYILKLLYTSLDFPNKNKILKISTVDEFDKFTFKYGCISGSFIGINWHYVAKDFGGIEIIPYISERTGLVFYQSYKNEPNKKKLIEKYIKHGFEIKNRTLFWYSSFDIASGCVWNPKVVKKFSIIKKTKSNKYKLVDVS